MKSVVVLLCSSLLFVASFITLAPAQSTQPGWPVGSFNLPPCAQGLPSSMFQPTLADVDGDGALEVLVGDAVQFYVIRGDGTPLPGWPIQGYGGNCPDPCLACGSSRVRMMAGNVLGGPELEIFGVHRVNDNALIAFDHLGQPLIGWPFEASDSSFEIRHFALGQLDADPYLEVVIASAWNWIYALDGNGTMLPGYPVHLPPHYPGAYMAGLAIADVDYDGVSEILVSQGLAQTDMWSHGRLTLLDADGTTRDGFPMSFPPDPYSGHGNHAIHLPVIADLYPDLQAEIAGGVWQTGIVGSDGAIASPFSNQWESGWARPAVGDLDGDGDLELVVGGYRLTVHSRIVQHYQDTDVSDLSIGTSFTGVALADIDGDGDLEIAAWGGAPVPAIHLLDHELNPLPGFPLVQSNPGWNFTERAPAFGALDGDGDLELVFSSAGMIHAITFPGPAGAVPWGQTDHDAERSAFYERYAYPPLGYRPGDCNRDAGVDLGDVIVGALSVVGLDVPPCVAACDTDRNGVVDLVDAVCLAQYLYLAGPPPQPEADGCLPSWEVGSSLPCASLRDCADE